MTIRRTKQCLKNIGELLVKFS